MRQRLTLMNLCLGILLTTLVAAQDDENKAGRTYEGYYLTIGRVLSVIR